MFDPKHPDVVYGTTQKHESIGPDKTGTLGPEHAKGKRHVQRAKDIRDLSVSDPAIAEDRKKRSKSGKSFLRDLK
jgi:hypothetical protein